MEHRGKNDLKYVGNRENTEENQVKHWEYRAFDQASPFLQPTNAGSPIETPKRNGITGEVGREK